MKTVLGALFKGGVTTILVLVIVCLLLWFGGAEFGLSRKIRVIAVGAVAAVAVLVILIQKVMAVRSALLIEQKLRAQAQEQVQSARPDQRADVQAVQTQLDEAIQALKTSRLGKGALYKLPWYMIIGPPGSGKSTALQESGLNFPYVSQGRKGVRGVGGTRNCDWWFTDEGILLDTAGRYTTEIDDRDEWLGFLSLLKQARKHKPINGAIVAVAVSDLLGATEDEMEAHAKNIRDRIDELTTQLEIVFPVYLLFTKCDLLQGFVEFFEDFTKQDRSQVWGCSLPYASSAGKPYRDLFEEETQRLFRKLSDQRLAALASERPSAKKQNIYLFPMQFHAATKKLGDFVGMLFRPNPFQENSVFRGFYFTSGTQEGTPIDQVIRSMSAAFGLKDDGAAQAAPIVDKKSYFINHLFTKIIFPDQTLARTSLKVQRRRKVTHVGTLGLSAVGTVFLLIVLVSSFFSNRSLMKEAQAGSLKVKEVERTGAEEASAIETLDELRKTAKELDEHDRDGAPLGLRWGLYRGGRVNPDARRIYFSSLRKHFIAPAAEVLRKEIETLYAKAELPNEEVERLFTLNYVYQMLGGVLKPERDVLEHALLEKGAWSVRLGGKVTPAAEENLKFFLSQLDRPTEWQVPVDRVLAKNVTDRLARGPIYVLQTLRETLSQGKGAFPKLGTDDRIRGRGREFIKFNYEFSRLYTQEGWNDYFRKAIEEKGKGLEEKYRVLGVQRPAAQLEGELRELFQRKYAEEWSAFLQGVKIQPFVSVNDASDKLKIFVDEGTPLKELLKWVWEAQRLQTDPAAVPTPVDPKPLDDALVALLAFAQEIEAFVNTAPAGARFLGAVKEGKIGQVIGAFNKALQGLDAAVRQAPAANRERFKDVMRQLIDNTQQAMAIEAQKEADDLWARTVYRLYRESVAGRYPFDEGAAASAPIAGLSQLFNGQSGLFWSTLNDLRAMNSHNLVGKPLVSFSREFSAAVGRAEAFRQALFRGTGDRFSVPFKVVLKQREAVSHVKITLGRKEFTQNDRPDNRGELVWEGETLVKLSIHLIERDRWDEKEYKDDWGLFRLFQEGKPQALDDRTFKTVYDYKILHRGKEDVYHADVIWENDDRVNLFQKDFFGRFSIPEKVGQ